MDVSFLGEDNFCLSYVSCIAIDGVPILAPVMTDAKRAEMRDYRAIAVEREKRRMELKEMSLRIQQSAELVKSLLDMSPQNDPVDEKQHQQLGKHSFEDIIKSTKNDSYVITKKKQALLRMNTSSNEDSDSSSVSDQKTQLHMLDEIFQKSTDERLNVENSDTCSDVDDGGRFASLDSSTKTFIVQKHEDKNFEACFKLTDDESDNSNKENEVDLLDFDVDLPPSQLSSPNSKSMTFIPSNEAILFGERESSYKRKRPASYFDSDNQSMVSKTFSTTTPDSESTSLHKYISAVNSHVSNATITPTDLDRLSTNKTFSPTPLKETFTVDRTSHVINTDFVSAAAVLSQNKDALNRSEDFSPLTSTVRRKNIFDSPSPRFNSARKSAEAETNYHDIQGSTFIPSSAENSPPERLVFSSEKKPETRDSDNSDKENRSFKKKHVRKLSYTLLTPSAALLAASSQGIGPVPLAPLISEPSSVGTSVNATPEKAFGGTQVEPPASTTQELDSRLENLNTAMLKLQQLNLGKGKKVHLERYLGDQRMLENQALQREDDEERNPVTDKQSPTDLDLEMRFKKLQEQHKNQLEILAEMHRQQQIKMERQFMLEKERLIEELSQKSSVKSGHSAAASMNTSFAAKDEELISLFSNESPSASVPKESPSNEYKANDALIIFGSGIDPHPRPNNSPNPLISTPNINVRSTPKSEMYPWVEIAGGSNIQRQPIDESPPIVCTNTSVFPNKVLQGLSNTNPMMMTPLPEPLGYTGLSKLQSRMHALSPNCFKSPVDSRSPLLKGLIYLDPLNKPKGPIKIPLKVSDPQMKLKFEKVTAAVKGYLTRRLLHSEKIQLIIQTIRDTVALVLRLHEEAPEGHAAEFMVKPQDAELHKRLLQQLSGACNSFHNVFFKLSTAERMAIIATDREKLKAKAIRNVTSINSSVHKRNNISVATLKCLERRLSSNRSSVKKESPTIKKVRSSFSNISGAQSVKPKAVASYKISPKRRRTSFWDRDQMISNRVTKPGRLSSSNWKSTARKSPSFNLHSSRSDNSLTFRTSNNNSSLRSSRSNQETFLVSSNRPPTGLSQPMGYSQSTATRSNRSRVPWKTKGNVNPDSIDRKW